MKKYRVAIVGLGRMASTIDDEVRDYPAIALPYSIAASCQEIEKADLVAGADILQEKREAFGKKWGVKALYDDYMEMIHQEKPDLVAICTRGELHAEMAVKVAEAGVPMIYLEKAMACSMKESDQVLQACQKNKTLLNTGVLRRFDTRYHKAREIIEKGEIGNPRAVIHYGATNLLHGHIHSIDTIMYLLGDPIGKSVWGELIPREIIISNNRLDKDPSAIYHIEFEGGMEAWTVPAGMWDFEIWGDKGCIRGMNNGIDWTIRKPFNLSEKHSILRFAEFPDYESRSATVVCLEDLINSFEENRPTLGNVEVTYRATEMCLAVAESHIHGKRISLPMTNKELYIWHV
ncbi:Gfo/Idh/MocA family oxidoreductase [Candidatus Poribacteria bacterium]|nr:Gfo/Idh/MocA family oxidoreductase [Candidatus Poribacteria bacterium]